MGLDELLPRHAALLSRLVAWESHRGLEQGSALRVEVRRDAIRLTHGRYRTSWLDYTERDLFDLAGERLIERLTIDQSSNEVRIRAAGYRAMAPRATAPATVPEREAMTQVVALARMSRSEPGRVSPLVGSAVVRDGVLLGTACRGELDLGEHAEYTLLERKLGDATLAGTVLYTSLEPCTARGAGKVPCVDRIIERRIKRVVIGMLDPNPVIRGQGELALRDAGVEVTRFDPDLAAEIEEMNREFTRLHRPERRIVRRAVPADEQDDSESKGPNGYKVGYTEDGDKVEWVPDDEVPGTFAPLLLRRSDKVILGTYNQFWDKVWYNRKQNILAKGGDLPEKTREVMAELEARYGAENLMWDDFEWGLLSGRMSALAWVMGAEWEWSLDT